MQRTPIWKPILVLTVVLICGLLIYPPKQKLKLGIDLAGGTTFIYEVQIPPGQDARRVIDDTIAVLRQRVDPTGVRNLIWRQQPPNRIEIQMAHASEATKVLREQYVNAQQALIHGNVSRRDIDGALRAQGGEREAQLDRLAGKNDKLRAMLAELTIANDAFVTARTAYETEKAAASRGGAGDQATTAPATQPAKPSAALIRKTAALYDAKQRFEAAQAKVLATNIEPADIERVLALPTEATDKTKETSNATNPREEALKQLKAHHPDRAAAIDDVAAKHAAYEKLKGPLDDPEDLKALLRGSGVLEFRIAPSPTELPDVATYREQLKTRGPDRGADKPYRWFIIDDLDTQVLSNFRGADRVEAQKELAADPAGYFAKRDGIVGDEYGGAYYVLLSNLPGSSLTKSQPGWELVRAEQSRDDFGLPAVAFTLNKPGGQLLGAMTRDNVHKPMAIVLDGRAQSWPNIQEAIPNGQVRITRKDGYSNEEVDYMLRTLNAGSLQARLSPNPISQNTTGPQFGEENLHAGLKAAYWSFGIVSLLMIGYYFVCGVIADMAMALNILITLAAMAMFEATFTLPGIAGVVLTIGVSVDANVLIYERIREELERGHDLHTSIRLGFDRAFVTILDAHVTTLITCAIIYYTASADIKGFAVTLGIGLLANLFTGIFVTRVVSDLYVDWVKPRTLLMLPIAVPAVRRALTPSIDWVGKRFIFYTLSSLVIIGGIIAMWGRGADLLDIEFRSGTQVAFELAENKELPTGDVQTRLKSSAARSADEGVRNELGNALVVTVGDTRSEGGKVYAHSFSIATLATNPVAVSEAIKHGFSDVLSTQRPIAFKGMAAKDLSDAPVHPVTAPDLGQVLGRTDVREDVGESMGGVVVLLDDMEPATTTADLTQRISRMRMQPGFESLGMRQFTVYGLDTARDAAPSGEEPRYRSAVVVTRDPSTDYLQNPDTFSDPGGLAATEWKLVHDAVQRDTSLGSVSNFSSQVSGTMKQQAVVAIVLSLIAIASYVWLRFSGFRYGIAALLSLFHDVMVALGMIAISKYLVEAFPGPAAALGIKPFRIDLAQVAAILTLVGYSINDTIVIFDRVRENRGRLAHVSAQVINDSVNQCMSRSVLTVGTVFVSVLLLYIIGGEGVRGFAYTMLIGTISGTYSTIAIASPTILLKGTGGGPPSANLPAKAQLAKA